jgi:hypothetical protein
MDRTIVDTWHFVRFFQAEKFHPIDVQPGDITFEWSLPGSEQNGVIRKFTISYAQEVSSQMC